jgi:hypothetical protein
MATFSDGKNGDAESRRGQDLRYEVSGHGEAIQDQRSDIL